MTDHTETTEPVTYEKGSWQESLQKSSNLLDRSAKARKTASNLLWKGAKEGIEDWLPEADTDVSAESLYANVIAALGRSRKGDASKIKTVAVAARNHGMDLSSFPNLSKAYTAARALTVVADQQAEEDNAADEAVANIEAPKTTSSVDGAAALLLSKGVDGAVVAILDALGATNEAAHKAFLRAVSVEVTARQKAAADAANAEKKAEADKARAERQAEADKARAERQEAARAKAKERMANAKPKPTKAKVAKETAAAPVDELEVEVEDEVEETEVAEAPKAPAKKPAGKGRPVVRRPGR